MQALAIVCLLAASGGWAALVQQENQTQGEQPASGDGPMTRAARVKARFDTIRADPHAFLAKVEERAESIKTALQMVIGVVTVIAVAVAFPFVQPTSTADATSLLLNGVGVGLAAAAVVELAYTLFTPGPDEALDPLMLGLSATLLLQLTRLDDDLSLQRAGALLLLGLLLALLFATRLLLAERHRADDHPRVWWVRSRIRKTNERPANSERSGSEHRK